MTADICVEAPLFGLQEPERLSSTSCDNSHLSPKGGTDTHHHGDVVNFELKEPASTALLSSTTDPENGAGTESLSEDVAALRSTESHDEDGTIGQQKSLDLTSSWFDPPWGVTLDKQAVKEAESHVVIGDNLQTPSDVVTAPTSGTAKGSSENEVGATPTSTSTGPGAALSGGQTAAAADAGGIHDGAGHLPIPKAKMRRSLVGSSSRLVMVAVDESPIASYAFKWYCDNVWKSDDFVVIVYIPETPTLMPISLSLNPKKLGSVPAEDWGKMMSNIHSKVMKIQNDYESECETRKIKHKFVGEAFSKPGQGICQLARDENVDMIVLGSRGSGGLNLKRVMRVMLGSVSEYVIRNAGIPVIIVQPKSVV